MYKFTITKNTNADHEYFDYWMRNQYPTYEGFSFVDGTSYIGIYTSEQYTQNDINAVKAFYDALTVDDTIDKKHCVIYDYIAPWIQTDTDKTTPPCHINYTNELTQRLQPILTNVFKGEVRQIIYYAEASIDQYGQVIGTHPIVKEDMVYTRDVAKMAISRTMTISWYRNDGTLHPTTKVLTKLYAPQERIAEGQRLRKNIIDFCQPVVLGMIMATEQIDYNSAISLGAQLSNTYSNEMNSWVNASRDNTLIQIVIDNNTISWLDNVVDAYGHTIRDHILDQLNY